MAHCQVKGTGRVIIQLLKDDINFFFFNQKTKMAICTKQENVIGANRRHFSQVVAV
jgi:hypothetical protein